MHALALFPSGDGGVVSRSFGEPTAPQREGWPAIARGESTLILAPTGTGKTLAAFLWCLDRLMLGAGRDAAERGCRVVYISPLKALAADVERNLRVPLAGIATMAQEAGVAVRIPAISMRTGDTPPNERARFRRHPGDILITTPESLYLMLTVGSGRGTARGRDGDRGRDPCAGPDQARRAPGAVAGTPGGAGRKPAAAGACSGLGCRRRSGRWKRWRGFSAAVKDKWQSASQPGCRRGAVGDAATGCLGGVERARSREDDAVRLSAGDDCECGRAQAAGVEGGSSGGGHGAAGRGRTTRLQRPTDSKRTSIWQSIYPRLLEIVRGRTSTLIFVNARRVAERLAGALNDLAGEPIARAHHGSLAAAQRVEIEELLKAGQIKALVATQFARTGHRYGRDRPGDPD